MSDGVRSVAELLSQVGPAGPVVVILLQVLQAVISPLPSWPITMASGALYGPLWGTLYSLIGGTIGAMVNFAIARRYGRGLVQRLFGDTWVERSSRLTAPHFLMLSLIARLIPVASFDMVAYVGGISRVRLLPFLGVTVLGQAPALLAYAYFGSDLASAESAGLWSGLLLALFVALAVWGGSIWRRLTT